jgi:hypothetical protein
MTKGTSLVGLLVWDIVLTRWDLALGGRDFAPPWDLHSDRAMSAGVCGCKEGEFASLYTGIVLNVSDGGMGW